MFRMFKAIAKTRYVLERARHDGADVYDNVALCFEKLRLLFSKSTAPPCPSGRPAN